MPIISSQYQAPWYLRNANLQTILPAIFRRVTQVNFIRQRVMTPDNDFLDVDLLHCSTKKIALLVHGLEASTNSGYIRGMAKALHQAGWLIAAMNLRGITHAPHELQRTYHSGATHDVNTVVNYLLEKFPCDKVVLIGFSLGANLVVKYAGEKRSEIDSRIKRAVAISVPCDLFATAKNLDSNKKFYGARFLKSLKARVKLFHERLPFSLSANDIDRIRTLREYDDVYTAPMFGFKNAEDYYEQCSCKKFIVGVKIPLLILNAKDDPFFTQESFPYEECRNNSFVQLETPDHGGHVGFIMDHPWGKYYSEVRTLQFLKE